MPRISFTQPAFWPDSRANRIERRLVTGIAAEPDPRQWLNVCGPVEAMTQLDLLASSRAVPATVADQFSAEYNHARLFPRGVPADVWGLAGLLQTVLTMTHREHVDFALALDWYKVPSDEVAPNDWPNTPIGELVSRGKYWTGQAALEARKGLMREIAALLEAHPLLASADALVTVPGHNADGQSFGERFARKAAEVLGKPLIETVCPHGPRVQQKEGATHDLAGQFAMPEVLEGSVIILDDVYRTGGTMSAVALAARQAGAEHVYGVTAVRTLRGR